MRRTPPPPLPGLGDDDCRIVPAAFPTTKHLATDPVVQAYAGTVACFSVDPPYNIGVDYGDGGAGDRMSGKAFEEFLVHQTSLAHALLRPGGAYWVILPVAPAAFLENYLNHATDEWSRVNVIVWHYGFGQYGDGRFISSHVRLLYYVKNPVKQRVWRPKPVLEPSLRRSLYGDKRITQSALGGFRPFLDVWFGEHLSRIQGGNQERRTKKMGADADHPNQLPEMLLARIIRCCTRPGDVVADNCLGSGTTATVARALGRRFVGWELNPAFAASALKRVKKGPVRDVAGPLATPRTAFPDTPGTVQDTGKTRRELVEAAYKLLRGDGKAGPGCPHCDSSVGHVCEVCTAIDHLRLALHAGEEAA